MKMAAVFYRVSSDSVPIVQKEASRYAGYVNGAQPDERVSALIDFSVNKMRRLIAPQAVCDTFSLDRPDEGILSFAGIRIMNESLSRNLKNCNRVVVFAATIGPRVDMLIKRTVFEDSAAGAVMQGVGAMFIESFVDMLNCDLADYFKKSGYRTHPRFSPGYGKVPLTVQKNIFGVLPCSKIGLSLTDSMTMSPEKSVTAFIGVEKEVS